MTLPVHGLPFRSHGASRALRWRSALVAAGVLRIVACVAMCSLLPVANAEANQRKAQTTKTTSSGSSKVDTHPGNDDAIDPARAAYEEAVSAYEARRFKDAIDLFTRADDLSPNPAFDFNIGIAYEDMGDVARALAHYRSYLRRDTDASDRAEVDERIHRMEKKLEQKGLQQVTILSDPPGARFLIDGEARGVTPWTGEVPPGFHRLTVDLRGYGLEERSFDLPPSRSIDVPVTLTRELPRQPARTPVAPAPAARIDCDGACLAGVETSSWVIAGIGLASLVGALAFELDRRGVEDASKREPNQVEAARLYDEALASQRWATALGLMGGAMFVTGGVLAYTDVREAKAQQREAERRSARSATSTAFGLGCAPTTCRLAWTHSF